MRMFPMIFLMLVAYGLVLYWLWSMFRTPDYRTMLDRLQRDYPNCQFVVLYGAKSKRPYAFTLEPKLSMLLIVDMESLNRYHTPPEPMVTTAIGTDTIPEFELIDYIKEKLNVPESRHPNSG